MRSALVRGALAVTSLVALAFVVPLALVVQQVAHDRALADARHQATGMVAALAVTEQHAVLARAVAATQAGAEGRLVVHLPAAEPVGEPRASSIDVVEVGRRGRSATVPVTGGVAYLQPTVLKGGRTAVIEVFVPDLQLRHGVGAVWLALAAVGVTLVAGSVTLADRLGARVVAAAGELARAALALGGQDLAVRVRPAGPPELVAVGTAFNTMADRIVMLVNAEREGMADLSHRLRTPLASLRLEADALPASAPARRIRESVDALDAEIDAVIASARRPVAERTQEAADLVEVLADRLAFWTVPAEHQSRPWEVRGGDQPARLAVSRADAIGAVDALLGNVFRHTPAGAPVRITVEVGATEAALVVEDGGPGIADPDSALRRGRSGADSTGLGLDIVRRLATAAGGAVSIDRSDDLGGARVTVTMPLSE